MIYFVKAATGQIKIGFSRDATSRIASLQGSHPERLTTLVVVPGERCDEKALHGWFAESREVGEWFSTTPELDELIRRLQESPLLLSFFIEEHEALTEKSDAPKLRSHATHPLHQYIEGTRGTDAHTSVAKIAKQIGVHFTTVYRWIEGGYPIPLYQATAIRDLTGGAVDYGAWSYSPATPADGKAA